MNMKSRKIKQLALLMLVFISSTSLASCKGVAVTVKRTNYFEC